MLPMFEEAGINNSNKIKWQFWQQNNKPFLLRNEKMALRVLMYLHKNPVVLGFVEEPQYWLYSSALGYYCKKGLPDVRLLF
jgi:putative transposase